MLLAQHLQPVVGAVDVREARRRGEQRLCVISRGIPRPHHDGLLVRQDAHDFLGIANDLTPAGVQRLDALGHAPVVEPVDDMDDIDLAATHVHQRAAKADLPGFPHHPLQPVLRAICRGGGANPCQQRQREAARCQAPRPWRAVESTRAHQRCPVVCQAVR